MSRLRGTWGAYLSLAIAQAGRKKPAGMRAGGLQANEEGTRYRLSDSVGERQGVQGASYPRYRCGGGGSSGARSQSVPRAARSEAVAYRRIIPRRLRRCVTQGQAQLEFQIIVLFSAETLGSALLTLIGAVIAPGRP